MWKTMENITEIFGFHVLLFIAFWFHFLVRKQCRAARNSKDRSVHLLWEDIIYLPELWRKNSDFFVSKQKEFSNQVKSANSGSNH